MDFPTPSNARPSPPVRPGGWNWVLPGLALLLYALLLAHYMGACAGGPDSAGYLNNARLLSRGQFQAPLIALADPPPDQLPAYTYVPLCFNPSRDGRTLMPTYPLGLPLLIMAAAGLVGWAWAPTMVIGLQSLLGLWLMHRMARACGLEPGWSLLAAAILAASPLYFFLSLQALSDLPAMVWTTAAVLCAWESRDRPGLALAAGAALSLAVLVRPTSLLALLPVGLALGCSTRPWAWLLAGGLPGALFFFRANLAAYGRGFTTGYGDMAGLFRLENIPVTLEHYARWLPLLLTPFLAFAVGLPFVRGLPSRLKITLAAWALVFPVFYATYFHTHELWWSLRFILPAFPPLLIASMLVLHDLFARLQVRPRLAWAAPAGGLMLLGGVLWCQHLRAYGAGRSERAYAELAGWLEDHLPPNAVIATMQAGAALYYYDSFVLVRWDVLQPDDFRRIAAACAAAGRPIYAALFDYETQGSYRARFERSLGTHWTKIASVHQATIWRFDSSARDPNPPPPL
jgi:hypothetical protein